MMIVRSSSTRDDNDEVDGSEKMSRSWGLDWSRGGVTR